MDQKYSDITQNLSFVLDNTPTTLEMKVQGLVHTWFLRKKQIHDKNVNNDAHSILKRGCKELKLREYIET